MMVGKLRRGIERYGWFALARLSVYPIVLLFWMPYRLLVTLWNARVLANGRWSEYNRFKAVSGINSLFYWTIAYNIDRYGRSGISPHIGLGNFQLAKMFHVSLPSIYAYWRAGAVLPFASMMVWLAIHLLWGGG
ncbi:MAG: hypothetical protein OEV64_11115, partial [Desulfobulbaceae bacterium]|nr:hypothetical protein [Desulfobulbaceae bacterium]